MPGGSTTPSKFEPLSVEEVEPDGARRGQVLIMFAIFLVAMLGMLGLATDVGYALAAKRSVQGAADAGALAGARQIAMYTQSAPRSAIAEVNAVVAQNTFASFVPSVYSCQYIGNNWSVVGTCDQNVPANAAGSRVRTKITVPTYFMRIFPATPDYLSIAGYAKARVQNASKQPSDAPFMICGTNAWDVTSNPTGMGPAIGSNLNILSSTSPFKVSSNAAGKTFRIHDSRLSAKGNADCSSVGDKFTGLADQAKNASKNPGSWFNYAITGSPGSTITKVDGVTGCVSGVSHPYGCVMILPVAIDTPSESGTSQKLYVAGYAAFSITTVDSETHNATLLDDFIVSGTGASSWCRDCGGVVVIRLIW